GLAALVAADTTAPFTAAVSSTPGEARVIVTDRADDTPDATPATPPDAVMPNGDDPFFFEVKRGGGTVLGVFDVDGAGVTSGSQVVPLIPAEYQALVALFPQLASFFPTDVLDYVARPVIEILDVDGQTVLAQSGDPTRPLLGSGGPNPLDLGSTGLIDDPATVADESRTTYDPFLQYAFGSTCTPTATTPCT